MRISDWSSDVCSSDLALARVKPEEIRKKGKVPKNASVFFTIFQTFMSGPVAEDERSPGATQDGERKNYFGEYPPDFFDLIIIDECHRGGANDESNLRGRLEYFAPAVQLCLPQPPTRNDHAHTYPNFAKHAS